MIQFRPHQEACINAILGCQDRFAVADVAVACGKSLILGGLAATNPGRTLIIAHTRELVKQDAEACEQIGIRPGICSASIGNNVFGKVTVGTIQTIINRTNYFQDVNLVLVDEVHRTPINKTSSYRRLFDALPQAKIRGVTGTAFRADGTGSLEKTFGPIVFRYKFNDALRDGYVKPLIPAIAEEGTEIDTAGLKTVIRNGEEEFDMGAMAPRAIQLIPAHCEAITRTMQAMSRQRVLVFACSIEHANKLEKMLPGSKAVHSELTNAERNAGVAAFRCGELPILISVAMFDTGFNVPDIDMLSFCRATKSPVFFAQALGRGARPTAFAENCAVLDFGGNVTRHGTLDVIAAAPGVMLICDGCAFQWESWKHGRTCPHCGDLHKSATKCKNCKDRFDQFTHGGLCPHCGIMQSAIRKCAACDEPYAIFLHPWCPHCGYDNTSIRDIGKDLSDRGAIHDIVNVKEFLDAEPWQRVIGNPHNVRNGWILNTKYASVKWPYEIIPQDIHAVYLTRAKNGRVQVRGYYDGAGVVHQV